MALIGLSDKRCVVGRAGHSAKTKAHRGREIDVLIFPFEGQAAGYSARRRGHGGKMWSLLFPFRRLFLFPEKGSPRSPHHHHRHHHHHQPRGFRGSRAGRWWQRGGVCVKEGGIIATSFTIYPDEENGRGNCKRGRARRGGREGGSRPVAYYFSLRVLFQPTATWFSQVTVLIQDQRTTPAILWWISRKEIWQTGV